MDEPGVCSLVGRVGCDKGRGWGRGFFLDLGARLSLGAVDAPEVQKSAYRGVQFIKLCVGRAAFDFHSVYMV